MEGREGIAQGVTLIGAEAPSGYHVAQRLDNPSQAAPPLPAATTAVVLTTPAGGVAGEKKKRGRPRKYAPDGTVNMALSPRPISSSCPRPVSEFSSAKQQGKSRAPGSDYKQKQKIESGYFPGEANTSGLGTCFMPHIVKIKSGEDITMKIIALSQQGPRAVCILSASGSISTVTLVQDGTSGGTLTYEGRFEILQLSGAFTPTEVQGTRNRAGSMSITVVGPNGQVLGGVVAGLLIAASPIQLIVGSFLPINHQQQQQQQKPKKQKPHQHHHNHNLHHNHHHSGHVGPTMPGIPGSNPEKDDGHGHQSSGGSMRPDLGAPSHFQRENWPSMNAMHEPRSLGTDINMEANLNGGGGGGGGGASRSGLNLYPDHSDH